GVPLGVRGTPVRHQRAGPPPRAASGAEFHERRPGGCAMTRIDTILHPTDFSDRSAHAFELACSLARDHGARLVVLHVVPSPLAVPAGSEALPPGPEEFALTAEKDQLAAIQSPDPAVPVERRLVVGNPVEEILRAAAETGSDLVVMGTHGRTGLGRLLMG